MSRVNRCPNPAADIDTTGWVGAYGVIPGTNNQSAGTVRATGLTGLPKSTGFKCVFNGGFFRSQPALISASTQYTFSYTGLHGGTGVGLATSYLVWYNADGSDNSYINNGSFASLAGGFSSGDIKRVSITATAPAGVVAAGIIQDCNVDSVVSALLIEPGATANSYADGDTAGWAWDGTPGLSSSTESSSTTGLLAGALPTPTGTLTGSNRAALVGELPTPGGALAGTVSWPPISGAIAGQIPIFGGSLAGQVPTTLGVVAGDLPAPVGSLTGVLRTSGQLSGEIPGFSGALTGLVRVLGAFAGSLPGLGGSLKDIVTLLTQDEYALDIHRENTRAFIRADPFSVTLRTRTAQRTATGGVVMSDGSFRSPQIGKLIMISPAGGSIEQRTGDGTERQVDYILLLEWDAEIEVGDWWDDQHGNRWEVTALIPTNNYETRAVVEAHGKVLTGG